MCLNGRNIKVSRNACEGIKQAGGTCGPCETIPVPPAPVKASTKKPVAKKAEKPTQE